MKDKAQPVVTDSNSKLESMYHAVYAGLIQGLSCITIAAETWLELLALNPKAYVEMRKRYPQVSLPPSKQVERIEAQATRKPEKAQRYKILPDGRLLVLESPTEFSGSDIQDILKRMTDATVKTLQTKK